MKYGNIASTAGIISNQLGLGDFQGRNILIGSGNAQQLNLLLDDLLYVPNKNWYGTDQEKLILHLSENKQQKDNKHEDEEEDDPDGGSTMVPLSESITIQVKPQKDVPIIQMPWPNGQMVINNVFEDLSFSVGPIIINDVDDVVELQLDDVEVEDVLKKEKLFHVRLEVCSIQKTHTFNILLLFYLFSKTF